MKFLPYVPYSAHCGALVNIFSKAFKAPAQNQSILRGDLELAVIQVTSTGVYVDKLRFVCQQRALLCFSACTLPYQKYSYTIKYTV